MSIRSPLLTGLIHPVNLLMLGVSVFAGLVSAWWLFPVGLVFWLVMVINVANDPSLRMSHRMQRRKPLAQRFQKRFDRLERFQVSIFNSLASAPPDVRRLLQPVQDETERVVDEAYALCRRMTGLENYRLVTQSQADLEAELNELNDMIDRTDDLMTRQEYEDSHRALQGRVEKLEVVSRQLDRVEAQLVSLSSELEGVVTEVVRLQAMGAEEAERRVNSLVETLREEAAQLKTFEREAVKV
jgi:chromosome segregation ATPase